MFYNTKIQSLLIYWFNNSIFLVGKGYFLIYIKKTK